MTLQSAHRKLQGMESSGLPCTFSLNFKKVPYSITLLLYTSGSFLPSEMSREDTAENKQMDWNISLNAVTTVCRFPLLVCITHFESLKILGVNDQDLGNGGEMHGKKKRLAIYRSSAARTSFQVVIIQISTSAYIKSPGANSSLIASGMGMDTNLIF